MAKKKLTKLSDLSFDDKNINKGSEFGSALLTKSLSEVGAGRSVLADKNGVLIAGNKTVEAFGAAGNTKIRVIETTGDELVVVQRVDLDINSPNGAKMKVLDNTVSKHNYIEDAEVAEAVCEEYDLNAGELGLNKNGGGGEIEGNFDDEGIAGKNQFGVMVICGTDAEQEKVFKELTNLGYSCKVVVT